MEYRDPAPLAAYFFTRFKAAKKIITYLSEEEVETFALMYILRVLFGFPASHKEDEEE